MNENVQNWEERQNERIACVGRIFEDEDFERM